MKVSKLFASILLAVVMVSLACTNAGDKGGEKTAAGDKAGEKMIVGYVSDGMCGLDHSAMKMGDDKACTLKCVSDGSKFVLADRDQKIVYTLDDADQGKAREFAGQKVNVTGHVDANAKTIHVTKIEAAT